MKHRISIKVIIISLVLLSFTIGCQKEDFIEAKLETEQVEQEVQEAEGPKMDVVMGEDIPEILEGIAAKTATPFGKVGDLGGKIRFSRAMINLRQANRVRNKDGVINYTFDLFPDNAPENAFYTLVVSKAKNGSLDEPYVIGYEMTDADFENFMVHDMDFRYFRAEQKFYNFDSFFTDSKNNRVGKSGDCGSNTVGSGNNGGGGHTAPGETFIHTYNGTVASSTFGTRQNANLYSYNITLDFNGGRSTASTTANSSSVNVEVTMPDGWGEPQNLFETVSPATISVDLRMQQSGTNGSPCFKGSSLDGRGTFTFYDQCPPSNQLKRGLTSKGTDCIVVNGGVSISVNLAIKKINSLLGEDYELNGKQMIALSKKNDLVIDIYDFLRVNTTEEDKGFVNWISDFEMLPKNPCGVNHDCVKSIQVMAEGLRKFHGEEGRLMAEYFDSLVSDYDSFTKQDLQVFYDTAKEITERFNHNMFAGVTGGFIDGVTPILEIALLEVGAPIAVKLLQKIPISWIYRGTRLNNMAKKVGLLGRQGFNNTIREVVTNSPITKGKELFNSLTKHAISKTTKADGAIVADMGNGNFITFRPITASSSNVPATISLDFKNIWSRQRHVKFLRQ